MTYNEYASYIQWRSDLLMSGRHADLARQYQFPVEIDLDGRPLYVADHEDVELQLHRLHLALNARDIRKLDPQISAVELPGDTQRVWVRWNALDRKGAVMDSAETIYLIDRTHGKFRIKAMHHTSLLVPEFAQPAYRNRLIRSRG